MRFVNIVPIASSRNVFGSECSGKGTAKLLAMATVNVILATACEHISSRSLTRLVVSSHCLPVYFRRGSSRLLFIFTFIYIFFLILLPLLRASWLPRCTVDVDVDQQWKYIERRQQAPALPASPGESSTNRACAHFAAVPALSNAPEWINFFSSMSVSSCNRIVYSSSTHRLRAGERISSSSVCRLTKI